MSWRTLPRPGANRILFLKQRRDNLPFARGAPKGNSVRLFGLGRMGMYGYTQPRHPALILERQCPVTWILSKEGLPRVCSEIWARSTYQACMLLHTRPLAQLSYTQLAFSTTPFPITRTGTSYTRLTTPETAPGAVWCFSDLSASPQRLRIHFHLQVLQRPAHRSITLSRMQPRDGDVSHSDLVRRGRVPSPRQIPRLGTIKPTEGQV